MAVQPKNKLFTILGFVQWGDFAELTTYRRPDGRLVIFKKTYPDKPPSPEQTARRAAFQATCAAWKALTTEQRAAYKRAAARLSMPLTGYNLYIALKLRPDPPAKATIERQAHVTLAP